MRHLASLLLLLPWSLAGQTIAVKGPSIGLFHDTDSGTLRIITGVPGATEISDALPFEGKSTRAHFPPRRSYALVEMEGSDAVSLVEPETYSLIPVPAVRSGATQVSFSPSGDSAAFYYSDEARILILRGFPSDPRVDSDFDSSLIGEGIESLAVADRARYLLAATSQGDSASVVLMERSGAVRRISFHAQPPAIFIVNGGRDALVLDRERGEVGLIRYVQGAAARSVLVEGPDEPSSLAVTSDGKRFVTGLGRGAIRIHALDGSVIDSVECGFKPEGIQPTGIGSGVLIQDIQSGVISFVDLAGDSARLFFIPRARRSAQ